MLHKKFFEGKSFFLATIFKSLSFKCNQANIKKKQYSLMRKSFFVRAFFPCRSKQSFSCHQRGKKEGRYHFTIQKTNILNIMQLFIIIYPCKVFLLFLLCWRRCSIFRFLQTFLYSLLFHFALFVKQQTHFFRKIVFCCYLKR